MVVQADPCVLRGIPEFFESSLEECLESRTESLGTILNNKVTFRELGPPDLCHIVKTNPRASPTQIGSYHFVLGVDASSSATFSAYLNSLTYMLGNIKTNPWKITSGTFCCFDAFSRVDVRVEVKIPGGVEAYVVDLKGERHAISNTTGVWQETHVSGVLRAILDDQNKPGIPPLLGLRKLDPLPTIKSEKRFLEAAAAEFFKGWQLGSSTEVQVPTLTSNHLTVALMKYFEESGRLMDAAAFFEPLFREDLEVGAVLASCYIGSDEEIKAVKVLYDASKRYPIPYEFLLVQAEFLMSKKQFQNALRLTKMAVTRAPSEFVVWEKLADIFTRLEDFESALLALNSCPMFNYIEPDAHRLPSPARTHLPLKQNIEQDPKLAPNNSGDIHEENDPKENEVHPELRRLPSNSLRGTFSRAYLLLTKICRKVGWDELLKYRSKVFVMEDEYRIHRAMAEEEAQVAIPAEQEEVTEDVAVGMESISLDDAASNKSGSPTKKKGKLNIDELMKKASNNPNLTTAFEQPRPNARLPNNPRLPFTGVNYTFKHKRLCEKWLDNLFMVVYNDLRIYTALKQEYTLYQKELSEPPKASSPSLTSHRKSGTEWEVYGKLCKRLHHFEDARDGFRQCLDQKLSTSALLSIIEIYANENSIIPCLQNIVRMVACLDRTFSEETYPSPIASGLFKLIRQNGLTKVQNALVAMNVNPITYKNLSLYVCLLRTTFFHTKLMSDERVTELLGFAPIHFIDETLNIANQSIYKSIAKFETKVEEFGGQNDKGVAEVETLLEKSIDSKFDRFELYCLKNIFSFPKDVNVVLPHYQGYDMNVTVEEEEQLDLKIDQLRAQRVAERYKNLKLQQAQERLEKRKIQLDRLNAALQELSTVAEDAEVYPVDKNLVDMKAMLDQVNQVMAQVESRTTSTEWQSVPLIGAPSSSSSRLKSVQQEVIYHLKKFNQKDGKNALSAWDVAHEYRDAVQVGSAKNIEAIRSFLL